MGAMGASGSRPIASLAASFNDQPNPPLPTARFGSALSCCTAYFPRMPRIDDDIYIGIDVQVKRGCCFYAMSSSGEYLASGWVPSDDDCAVTLRATLAQLGSAASRRHIGIDAPRMALPSRREWSWSATQARWSASSSVSVGRHCEVVVAAHKLATPQWTPLAHNAPEWMQCGFRLFEALSEIAPVFEIFPTAAYRQLERDITAWFPITLSGFAHGPKDMLDAALGAFVVREFIEGRGCEVGGGDGFGTIILPRPIGDRHPALHNWPGQRAAG